MKIKPMLDTFEIPGIEYLDSAKRQSLVEHRVLGLDGNYLQDSGSVPTTITIIGE